MSRAEGTEIMTQLADFFMPSETQDALVVEWRIYAFTVSDDEVNLTFPEGLKDLGGSQQRARLQGRLELFIEDTRGQSSEARMWIVDIDESIYDLNVFGIQVFTLETSMLDYAGFDFDNPVGSLNVETGEYRLTYVIHPRHPKLSELGPGEEMPPIVVREQGAIKLNGDRGATLITEGSLAIEEGPFAGTAITYSPKGGIAPPPPPKEVTLWLNLPATGCGTYAGTSGDSRVITGKGVFGTVRSVDAGTLVGFRGSTRTYTSSQWDSFWNGSGANGVWSVALMNRGIPCSEFPKSVIQMVNVRN